MKCDNIDCSFCMYGICDDIHSGMEQCTHRYIKSKEEKGNKIMKCIRVDCASFDEKENNCCSNFFDEDVKGCASFVNARDVCIEKKVDDINHPAHYNKGKYEVNDIIKDWFKAGMLDWNTCCAIKYIARCNFKENKIKDLKKAVWYLNDLIEDLEAVNEAN